MGTMKRLLNCNTSDLKIMNKQDKLDAIVASEGRIVIQEISLFGGTQLMEDVTDAEVACAFGADMLLLNAFDVYHPHISSIDCKEKDVIQTLKKYTGRLIGVNLEPVSEDEVIGERSYLPMGRRASVETAKKAIELGFDFILLTGNPGTGVTNQEIVKVMKDIHDACGDELIIMAGKMHAAGSLRDAGNKMLTPELVCEFKEAGADVILVPAPGTVPGMTLDYVSEIVRHIHNVGALALSAIGTSQEGASVETIRQIALMCKMTGVDLHHIGDAAIGGLDPISLMEYSITIRGKRHTYKRMARSINR